MIKLFLVLVPLIFIVSNCDDSNRNGLRDVHFENTELPPYFEDTELIPPPQPQSINESSLLFSFATSPLLFFIMKSKTIQK